MVKIRLESNIKIYGLDKNLVFGENKKILYHLRQFKNFRWLQSL